MTLSPRVGGATSKPTDVSPSPAGQRYASNSCITTKMTYEFFNELIENFLQAQTGYSVTNVPNDPQALKKLLDALRTGGFEFTVGTVNLRGDYKVTSPENVNFVIDDNNNQTDRSINVYINSALDANALWGINEAGQMQLFGRTQTEFNMYDVAPNTLTSTATVNFYSVPSVGGTPVLMGYIGKPFTTDENFLVRAIGRSLVLSSDTDVNVQLDANNNGTNSFNIFNGAGLNCFNVQEDGTTNTTTFTAVTASTTDLNASGAVTAQSKPVRAFTRAVCAVDAGGNIIAQKGIASVTKIGTGVYRVVISESATSPYFTQATAGEAGANTTNINATTTDVRTYNTSPSPMDAPFIFEVFY
jgi:hypothetical protein